MILRNHLWKGGTPSLNKTALVKTSSNKDKEMAIAGLNRVVRGSKLMHLELIHGLFIT
jgi:hypothetical protein